MVKSGGLLETLNHPEAEKINRTRAKRSTFNLHTQRPGIVIDDTSAPEKSWIPFYPILV